MKYNLPIDFLNRMKLYLGEEYDDFISSYELEEVKGIRFNTKAPGTILGALCPAEIENENPLASGSGAILGKIPWCENGYSYYTDEIRPGKHPYHESGAYYIQEPSAMAPVGYLEVEPGDRVLDLCASPGGKSTQIAFELEGEGILISNEIMPDRARILSENIERMGVKNAVVISEDPRNISDRFTEYFDKVLVDAPCSGEGMFRRAETAVNEWSLENVKICADRQSWILDEAAKMLRPGGTMVYSTCTFSKEEDEMQIQEFLLRHAEFKLSQMPLYEGFRPGFDGVGVRVWPHLSKGEGHYMCKLVKTGDSIKGIPPCGYEPDITKKDRAELKDMFSFFIENVSDKDYLEERRLTRFKDQIYMLPKECPSLKGLKVLRPGLHLGTILKNRFEPSHALARTFSKDEVKKHCDLSLDNIEVYKYFNGETFNVEYPNGWYVVFVDDFPMGWGKIANGILKNHYPKGLRKNIYT